MRSCLTTALAAVSVIAGGALLPRHAVAQEDCKMLICAPKLVFQPGAVVLPLGEPARTAPVRIEGGQPVVGAPREGDSNLEFAAILGVSAPTTFPRTGVFLQVIWLPFREGTENPFTEYAAGSEEIEDDDVALNMPTLEFGLAFTLLRPRTTNHWLGLNLNVLDQFGPAAEPDADRAYTHKLGLELDATIGIFAWLPRYNWLRNVEAYATLGYTATGLPDEGDVVPAATPGDPGVVYLEDANPWALWVGLTLPIAPIARE